MKFLQEKWKIKILKVLIIPTILLVLEGNIPHGNLCRIKTMLPSSLSTNRPASVLANNDENGLMLPWAVKVQKRSTSKLNFSLKTKRLNNRKNV